VDVAFLDANVLFSAAYRHEITSDYAAEEARRNLEPEAASRLEELLASVRTVPGVTYSVVPESKELPEKDRPILLAAVAAGATHLLTGDVTHFGPFFGRTVSGVKVVTPAAYLRGFTSDP
jgi:hypothetical protein